MNDQKLIGYLVSLSCILEEVISARGKELDLIKTKRFLTKRRDCGDIIFDVIKEVIVANNTPSWEATIRPIGKTNDILNDISCNSVTDEVKNEVRRFFDYSLINCYERVVAFRCQRTITESELDFELKMRGLKPANPCVFIETVKFLEESHINYINPLVTHWSKNFLSNEWYFLAANLVNGRRYVFSGDKRGSLDIWVEGTWFLGTSKYY
jgi:hypothetical protein